VSLFLLVQTKGQTFTKLARFSGYFVALRVGAFPNPSFLETVRVARDFLNAGLAKYESWEK